MVLLRVSAQWERENFVGLEVVGPQDKKFRTSTVFEPVISRYRCDAPNQLSYEATDVGSWALVGSNFPLRNDSSHSSSDHDTQQKTDSSLSDYCCLS